MAEINATILIPDISGFTQFMSTTELSHSSLAVNILIDTIINSVNEEYFVSEIEGDAVVLLKKDPAPTKEEIYEMCLRIFNTFHFQRMWMQQHTICPCKACVGLENLTLKFIVHRGPLAEIKVGGMLKHSGTEMIVAHRLMKNNIPNHEYVLMTDKLLERVDSSDSGEESWSTLSETFESIGEVGYHFAILNDARKKVPEPQAPKNDYFRDDTPSYEISIGTHFSQAYMVVMNIPGRDAWVPGLLKVEQDMPGVFIGSVHQCTFENYKSIVSPIGLERSGDEIVYAESCRIDEHNLSLVYEYVFKEAGANASLFSCRYMNTSGSPVPEEINVILQENLKQLARGLKKYCEKMEESMVAGGSN